MIASNEPATVAAPSPSQLADLLDGPESERAEADLMSLLRETPGNGAAASSLVDHLLSRGRAPEAVEVAKAYVAAREATPNRKLHVARLLLAKALVSTDPTEAARIAPSAEDVGDAWEAQLQRAKLMIEVGRLEEAIASCRLARAAMPAPVTPSQLVRLAKLANRAGNSPLGDEWAAEALSINARAGGLGERERTVLLTIRATNLLASGRYAEAYEAMEQAASITGDPRLESKALWIARYHGDPELLSRAREQQHRRGQQRLPSDLASGLAAIEIDAVPPLSAIPEQMEVPWRAAALPPSEWPTWASRFLWGAKASALLMRWLQFAGTDRQDQLADLLLPVADDGFRAILDEGRGVILVGTHLGPIAGVFPYLLRIPRHMAVVGGGGTEVGGVEGIVVPQLGRTGTLRALRDRLEQGSMAAVTIDMVRGDSWPVEICGRTLHFSSTVAKVSREWDVPSVWIQPEWSAGKIRLHIEVLPSPQAGETKGEWEQRWFGGFAGHLTEFLRTCSPESASGLRLNRPEATEAQATRGVEGAKATETAAI